MSSTTIVVLALAGALLVLVSMRMRKRRAAARALSLEERAVRAGGVGSWVWTPETNAMEVSDVWAARLGVDRSELTGTLQDWLRRVHPAYVSATREALEETAAGKRNKFACEFRIQTPQGYAWFMARGRPQAATDDRPARVVGVIADIDSVVEVERRVLDDAYRDRLTGLMNRHAFLSTLQGACLSARDHAEERFAVLFIDLDKFKSINDTLGHAVGDALLGAVAVRLENNRRPGDTVARLGGDEFVVLLRRVSGEEQAVKIARRLHETLVQPYRVGAHELNAGASIGVTFSGLENPTADQILRDADQAMYLAKSQAGGVVAFNDEMKQRAVRTGKLQTELSEAARRGLFELHFQPVFDLRNGGIHGVEALLRWDRGGRERMAAGEFIGLAKESGLIGQLDRAALKMACAQRASWLSAGLTGFRIAVNVGGGQLTDPAFPRDIERLLKKTGLPARMLEIEAGEEALVESLRSGHGILEAIDSLGVGVCLDDFGLGDTSIRYLSRLPVRMVKIDGAYLSGARRTAEGRRAIRGLVSFARELDILTAAEGVETTEDVEWLRELNIDLAQGYFFARPMDARAVTPVLSAKDLGTSGRKDPGRAIESLAERLAGRGKAQSSIKPN